MKKIRFLLLLLVALIGGVVSSSGKTVYIQPNSWSDANAVISLWTWTVQDEQESNNAWATLTEVAYGDGILKAELDDAINRMIVVRGSAGNTFVQSEGFWNQTGTIDITGIDGKLFVMGDIGTGAYETADYTEPLLRDYYLESDAALGFGGWNAVADNKMVKGTDNKFTLSKENVMLTVGSYGYKVYCAYNNTWHGDGENNKILTITENGFYTVTFTFDLTTGEPTAVATKTEAIGYLVDFNTAISTGSHDFAVAPMWKHIVGSYNDNYVSYSYREDEGVNGSGCLIVYDQNKYIDYNTRYIYDLLVTPKVSGTIRLKVKVVNLADATSYKNAFVQLYSLNSSATEKDALLKEFKTEIPGYNSGSGDWVELTYEVGSTPQRIGIRAQYVYMDNFIAGDIDNSPEPALTVSAVMNSAGATGNQGTNPMFEQQADGTMKVNLKVTLSNTGNVDFVAGTTENYTLTPATDRYGTKTYYEDATIAIPEDLAAGESKNFDVEFITPYVAGNGGYNDWYIRENVTGTTSSTYRYAQSVAYASKFIFDKSGTSYTSSSSATKTPIDFGKVSAATTVNYEIYNAGTAPLTINSFSIDAPFTSDAPTGEFTVAAKEKKQIAITFPAASAGIFNGNITIVYTNALATEPANPYVLGVSATVLDPSKNYITFDNGKSGEELNGKYPAGSIHSGQVYISSKTEEGVTNFYLQSTSTTTKFITPLLTAEANEAVTFDAWYTSYSSTAAVTLYISTDRVNWTQLSKATGLGSAVKTFTATIPEAGDYYLAFELTGNALLDNIYGLTLATAPTHDWYFTEDATIPTTGKQNADYTASIKVQNISSIADAVETATLYVGGEAVVTLNNVALAANSMTAAEGTGRPGENGYSNISNPTEISFTYKPHNFGIFNAYIELKSGDKTVTTNEVEVVIAEEKVESGTTVAGNTTTTYAPMYGLWMDTTGGSFSDFYYSKEQLTDPNGYNLKSGDVITAISFYGSASAKELTSLTGTAWVALESLSDFVVGNPVKRNMKEVTIFDHEKVNFTSGESKEIKIDLSSDPITYDGESIIRIFTNFDANGQYQSVTFSADSNYPNAYYAYGTSPSWNATGTPTPVATFSLAVEPTTLAGTVTDANGAVEGATVTIRNAENDIQYFATTAADGSYSINVIQDQLTYKAVADKAGMVSEVKNVEGATLDFMLAAPAYGEIATTASAGYFKYLAQEDDKLEVTYTEAAPATNTIKFTNNFPNNNSWTDVYAYTWHVEGENNVADNEWPGVKLTDSYPNEYNQNVFIYTLPTSAEYVIFNNGSGAQTVDIALTAVSGYYPTSQNGEGKWQVESWTDPSTAAIQLCDDKGAVVADATLDNGIATVELTDALIAKLAAGLYVTVKGTDATISKVELVKDDSYILAEDATGVIAGTYEKVKIARNFKAGWNAVCLPFGLSVDEVNAAFGADCEMAVYDGDTGGENVTVKFKKVDAGEYRYMTASYPYLIWLENPVSGVKFLNKTIESETPGAAVEGANAFEYVGVYAETPVEAGNYFMAGGKFVKATTNNKVLPFRAYLKLKSAGVRSVSFVIGDEVTAIEGLTVEGNNTNDAIYNLNGQKVQQPTKRGLYIINGKKVMVK